MSGADYDDVHETGFDENDEVVPTTNFDYDAVDWTATFGGAFSSTVGAGIAAGLGVTAAVGAGRCDYRWDAK
jgi:hypothetical protein